MFERLLFPYFCLLLLCLAHQLPCGRNCRGRKPLHSRTIRSIALWRCTALSQEEPHEVPGADEECRFCKNEMGCLAGDKCLFPHYKVVEQTNKKPQKSNFPRRRASDDKNVVTIVKSLSQMGCVLQDSDALVSQDWKWRGNRMQKVLEPILREYDSLCLRYVKRVSGKRNDHRWEKYKSHLFISEVPTLRILRTGPMKRLNDSSDVPQARLRILSKTQTSSKKKTRLHSTRFCRKVGTSRCVNKRAGRKRVCSWFRSEYAYGQQKRPYEDIKKSDDGDDGQRRGANKRRSDGVCQTIGLIRSSFTW